MLFSEVYFYEKVLYNDDKLKIVDTDHSRKRKRRSNNQWNKPITDKEILTIINNALPQLVEAYNNGEIKNNDKVWLYNPYHRLNVIISFKVIKDTNKIRITILTNMRHNKFHNTSDTQKKIVVKYK